jgi:parvulin-like peptidyl-prolyl isomerase
MASAIQVCVLAGGGAAATLGQITDTDESVAAARVRDTHISREAVHDLVKSVLMNRSPPPDSAEIARLSNTALQSLIGLEVLYQEALSREIAVSKEEVDREIQRVGGHFVDEKQFAAALRHSGLSIDELRADTRKTLMVDELRRTVVWNQIRVSETEVVSFYDENREVLRQPPRVHIREIVLHADNERSPEARREQPDRIRARLLAGEDFAELAYNYSTDRITAARGGDRGYVTRGSLPPEVEEVVSELPVNQISDVIASADGFHIVEVLERQPGRLPPLAEVREYIVAVLSQEERDVAERAFVEWLKKDAEIEIYPPYATAAPPANRNASTQGKTAEAAPGL